MDEKKEWEYRVESFGMGAFGGMKDEGLEALLNEWGEQGWEVIFMFQPQGGTKLRVIAKRSLSRERRRERSIPESNYG
jgi:hypothetical protein